MEQSGCNTGAALCRQEGDDAEGPAEESEGVGHAEKEEEPHIDHFKHSDRAHDGDDQRGNENNHKEQNEPTQVIGVVGQSHHLHTLTGL